MPAPRFPVTARALAGALCLLLVGLALYAPGLHGGYYSDDLFLIFAHPERLTLAHFFGPRAMHFFRPLDHAFVAWVQARVGLETWPIHALALAYHFAVVALTYAFGRMLRLSAAVCWGAAAWVLIHEIGPYGVAGVDTLSQMGGTAWGLASLGALGYALRAPERVRWGWAAASLGAYTVALLYKETSASFLPLAGVVIAALRAPADLTSPRAWLAQARRYGALLLPYLVVFGVYLAVRTHAVYVQPSFDDADRYGLHVGLNIPRNLAQFAAAVLLTGSTLQTYLDAQAHAWGRLALVAFGTLAFAAAVVVGLWRARAWKPTALLGVLALGACFPAALINQVSELYAYNALPFAALLVGIAGEALWRRSGRRARPALVAAALGVALVHGGAVRQKVQRMQARGDDARRLVADVVPYVRALPAGGRLALRNAAEEVRYSVFVLSGVELLRWGEAGLRRLAGRPDVQIVFADPAPAAAGPVAGATQTLVFEGGRLVVVP